MIGSPVTGRPLEMWLTLVPVQHLIDRSKRGYSIFQTVIEAYRHPHNHSHMRDGVIGV